MKAYQKLGIVLITTVLLCCGCGGQLKIESGGMLAGGDPFLADWTKRLPEWENQLGPFDGRLNLEEDEWLAVKAEHYQNMGIDGTFLIRSREEARFLPNKIIDSTGIISLSEPQIMRGWNSEWQPDWGGTAKSKGYFYGLYSLSEEKWILEPEYAYIGKNGHGSRYSIKTSVSDNTKDLYSYYDGDWNLLWSKELGRSEVYEVGDYIWIQDTSGVWDAVEWLTTSIYTGQGELVRTLKTPSLIKKSGNGSYNGWSGEGDIMCSRDEGGSSLCIYNPDGSLLFDRSMIPDSICAHMNGEGAGADTGIKVEKCLRDGRLVILKSGNKELLYDMETQELLSGPEDSLESNGITPQAVMVKHPDETRTIYRYDRTSPETSQGLPYLYLAQGDGEDDRQYYYRIDDGTVTLGDGEGMEYTYHGNFDENTWIKPYEGKLVRLKESSGSDAVTSVYLEEELVMSGMDLEVDSRAYSIEDEAAGEKITMDEDGNYHKGDINQSVYKMGTDFIVTSEKETLFSVIDGDGRPVVRLPKNYRYPTDWSDNGY